MTISIGGNDLGFANIVTDAATVSRWITPGILFLHLQTAKIKFFLSVRDDLATTYRAIRDAAGPQAVILIAGYPELLSGATLLGSPFNLKEVAMLNETCIWLDKQMASLIQEMKDGGFGNIEYVSVVDRFKQHGAYSDEPFFNGILLRQPQDLDQVESRSFVSDYSMHPNLDGAAAYAAAVQETINGIEAPDEASKLANQETELVPYTESDEDRVALTAFQTHLQRLLDSCNTVHNGNPAMYSEYAYGPNKEYTAATCVSYYSFAIGLYGQKEYPSLLVCSEADPLDGTAPTCEFILYSYDQETDSIVESNRCSSLDRLTDAMFYTVPSPQGVSSRCVELHSNADEDRMGLFERDFIYSDTDFAGFGGIRNRHIGVRVDGEDVYAYSIGAFDICSFRQEQTGYQTDFELPMLPGTGLAFDYRQYKPVETRVYEFSAENVASIV